MKSKNRVIKQGKLLFFRLLANDVVIHPLGLLVKKYVANVKFYWAVS